MDERFNQTLQNMLRKYVHENKKNWDNFLDALSYAYNTSRHESTLHTPFEVMFGRKAILPIDLDVERPNAAKLLEDIEGADTGQSFNGSFSILVGFKMWSWAELWPMWLNHLNLSKLFTLDTGTGLPSPLLAVQVMKSTYLTACLQHPHPTC